MELKNTYYIVRHGQALSNVLGVSDVLGNPDNHLTMRGFDEARRTGEKLLGTPITHIITSPFPRAKETAETIAEVISFPKENIKVDERLKEMLHGIPGQWKHMERHAGEIGRNVEGKDATTRLSIPDTPDAESFHAVRARMMAFIDECEKTHAGDTILIVTHRSPAWMLYSGYWRLSDDETIEWELGERYDDSPLANAGVLALHVPPEIKNKTMVATGSMAHAVG